MKFGLFGINLDVLAVEPQAAVRVARVAEESGWESLWAAEHYCLPDPWVRPSPARAERPILDPFVALTNVAAHTERILLGTGVTVVPLHRPVMLAKKVASVDRISGGRFLFGVGVGYLEPEFAALGVPFEHRGARLLEGLAALETVWTRRPASFLGEHVRFEWIGAEPRPLRHPIPVHFGGGVRATFERTVTRGRGWFGFSLDLAGAERAIAELKRAEQEYERPEQLGPLEISVTPDPGLNIDDDTVEAFAELGVTRLIPMPPREAARDADQIVQFVRHVGERYCREAHPVRH